MSARPGRIQRLETSLSTARSTAPTVRRAPGLAFSRSYDAGHPAYVSMLGGPAPDPEPELPRGGVADAPAPATTPGWTDDGALAPAAPPRAAAAPLAPAPAPSPVAAADPPAPPDPAPGSGSLDGWQVAPDAPLAQEQGFAQDIQAILAHAQGTGAAPDTSGRIPLPDVPAAPAQPAPAAPAHGVGMATTHDVFEQMSLANAPSRFDQGAVALSVDFDRLDRALAETAAAPPAAAEAPAVAPPAEPQQPSAPPVPAPTQPPAAEAPAPEAPAPDAPAPAAPAPTGPATVADVSDVAAITDKGGPFRVTADVPAFPQVAGLSCHAAACAAMVSWRDEVPPDPAAAAAGTGYWERYAAGRTAQHPDVADAFGLQTASAGAPPAADRIRDLLDVHGPLFVCASPPGEHAVVVSGITGDGSASGSMVDVVDPWAPGMTTFATPNPGSTYSVPYATLLDRLGAGADHHIVVAHLRKGLS